MPCSFCGFIEAPEQRVETVPEPKPQYCTKLNVNEDQQQFVRYAAEISGNDIDFLATLESENGLWTPDRKAFGTEPSYGFCQIHAGYHPEVVNDPRFFSDPYWQLDKCWEMYQGGVRFYGYDVRYKNISKFTCP